MFKYDYAKSSCCIFFVLKFYQILINLAILSIQMCLKCIVLSFAFLINWREIVIFFSKIVSWQSENSSPFSYYRLLFKLFEMISRVFQGIFQSFSKNFIPFLKSVLSIFRTAVKWLKNFRDSIKLHTISRCFQTFSYYFRNMTMFEKFFSHFENNWNYLFKHFRHLDIWEYWHCQRFISIIFIGFRENI